MSSWWGALDRPWLRAARFVQCVPPLDIRLVSGGCLPGFNPLRRGWVYRPAPEVLQKEKCQQGLRHFGNCWLHVGFGPVTEPTFKTALWHIRTLVGHMINTSQHFLARLASNIALFTHPCTINPFHCMLYFWVVISITQTVTLQYNIMAQPVV